MVRISDTLKQQNDLTSFPVAFGDSIWLNKDKNGATEDYSDLQTMYNNDLLGSGGSSIQVDTMPIASVDELGKIYEFIGSTGTYVNGYFYECVSDGEPTPTYSWVQKNVQPNAESFTFNEDDFNVDSSTDKVSLLPSRRVFNGSKADWDLLSVAEKTQYGATAFTDDEGSEMSTPVDVVESGNMHAVTSNAVAEITGSKIGLLSGKSTDIIEAFSQVGIPNDFYSKTVKQFCDNISTYSSGVHSLSIGGPAYGFVLWKHDNSYFTIDVLSYSDYIDNIIRVIKSNGMYTVCRYVK